MKNHFKNIKEYYPTYLLAHQNVWNRRLHVLGQFFTILYLLLTINLCINSLLYLPMFILLPFVVYPFAWTGHLYFEKNKPATWQVNPMYTKICDWIMLKDILLGNIPS
jgi:hypothetical protein